MPTSLPSSRATRDRMNNRSGILRESAERASQLFVEAVAEAASTAPVGSRPSWMHDLSTDLTSGKSVTVERVLRLAIAAGECGADLSTICSALEDAIGAECSQPVEPLDVAICGDQDATSAANPLAVRAMKWTDHPSVATIADVNALLKQLHDRRDELDDLIRSVARYRLDALRNMSSAKVTA